MLTRVLRAFLYYFLLDFVHFLIFRYTLEYLLQLPLKYPAENCGVFRSQAFAKYLSEADLPMAAGVQFHLRSIRQIFGQARYLGTCPIARRNKSKTARRFLFTCGLYD